MKKTLLSLAILLGLSGAAKAAEAVFDLADLWKYTDAVTEQQIKELPSSGANSIDFKKTGIELKSTDGSVTVKLESGTNTSNGPIYYNTNGTRTLRAYKNNVITFTSTEALKEIVIANNNTNFKANSATTSSGSISVSGKNTTWKTGTEEVKSVTLTIGASTSTLQFLSFTVNPEPKEIAKVADIAAFVAKADKMNPVIVEGAVNVVYVNGKNIYVEDKSGRLCIYNASKDWEYAQGDVIPGGFQGIYELRNGLAQMSSPENFAASTSKVEIKPEVMAIDAITMADAYKYVAIEKVTISAGAAARNYTLEANGKTFAAYDQFQGGIVPESLEGTFNVTGIVGAYKDAPQLLLTSVVKMESTAIEDIDIDSVNAPVEYFNLQGVRVANPENGLFIRRQGNKVTKVIIK